jgi:hypothetical protein
VAITKESNDQRAVSPAVSMRNVYGRYAAMVRNKGLHLSLSDLEAEFAFSDPPGSVVCIDEHGAHTSSQSAQLQLGVFSLDNETIRIGGTVAIGRVLDTRR